MLKCIRVVLVCLVVLCSLAYAPRTYAASADLMMVQIQAGGVGAATQELIVVYNNSLEAVNIIDHCLLNKSNAEIACFTTSAPNEVRYLPAQSFAVVASSAFVTFSGIPSASFTAIFEPLSQSSGSITGSGDTISLVDASGNIIDQHGWTTTLAGGMLLARDAVAEWPPYFFDTDTSDDWSVQSPQFIPDDQSIIEIVELSDLCPNIEGEQLDTPEGMVINDQGECVADAPSIVPQLLITELLPNAAGSDEGNEFIELYNPGDQPVDLSGYTLHVGPQLERSYALPQAEIGAGEYYVLSNSDIPFTLLNTSSRAQLTSANQIVSEVPIYQNPKEGWSWALIVGEWVYTDWPTPGTTSQASKVAPPEEQVGGESSLKPCAPNQYRNPETNRCRLIASSATSLKPCAAHQERSPTTNRCRNKTQATSLAPCKEGQERNAETNRCRNVAKVPQADYAVLGAETTQEDSAWYIWIVIGMAVLAALGYAAWEWRAEVRRFATRVRRAVLRR
jgi:hypothetical protein